MVMSDEERFTIELHEDEDLDPGDRHELFRVVEHLLDGGAVVYLEDPPTPEEMDKLEAFVDETLREEFDL
jgi:hypothetical protein